MPDEFTLLDLPQGAKGRVRMLGGDCKERSHLLALGFTPGAEVEMCQGDIDNCRVTVRDSSIVLGGGIAQRIICDALVAKTCCLSLDHPKEGRATPCARWFPSFRRNKNRREKENSND